MFLTLTRQDESPLRTVKGHSGRLTTSGDKYVVLDLGKVFLIECSISSVMTLQHQSLRDNRDSGDGKCQVKSTGVKHTVRNAFFVYAALMFLPALTTLAAWNPKRIPVV